jgi:hypothetical protein
MEHTRLVVSRPEEPQGLSEVDYELTGSMERCFNCLKFENVTILQIGKSYRPVCIPCVKIHFKPVAPKRVFGLNPEQPKLPGMA